MFTRTPLLALLAALWLPLPALAQPVDAAPEQPAAEQAITEQDVGTLQAELARVEAERQRLADELADGVDSGQLEQLSAQNTELRDRLSVMQEVIANQRQDDRRKWFIVGASTVALSLLVGWLLAQLGGRRKRNMWLN